MSRKLTSLLFVVMLVLPLSALPADSKLDLDASLRLAQDYGFAEESMTGRSTGGMQGATSLGSYSADGNSPGYIIGRSYCDRPAWYHGRHMVDWRGPHPQVHFVYEAQLLPDDDPSIAAQWMDYTAFDPTTAPNGVFNSTIMMHPYPLSHTARYPQLDVDETGHALLAGAGMNPSDIQYQPEIYWDVAGPGAYGSFLVDTIPQALTADPDLSTGYPMIEYSEYEGSWVTHVLALDFTTPNQLCYYRRVGGNPTIGGWSMTSITDDRAGHRTIVVSRATGARADRVAVVWVQDQPGSDLSNVVYKESLDGGLTWPALGTETGILDFSETGTYYMAWCELDAMYDTDGYLHIVFPTMECVDGASQGIDPARLYHWTDRVAGPNAGGTLSLIAIADFNGLNPMCGRAGMNVANLAKGAISECNGRLYVVWQQFGDVAAGDTTDCPVDNEWQGGYNADLYLSVSLGLNGNLWDQGRNLTNSHNPDCDSTTANNCDHDNYHSLARYGMNGQDATLGDLYWGAVPEAFQVRDALESGYPTDGWYIDVQFLDDLYPEVFQWMDEGIWSYNPIKWFRLPCVDPVIEPAIFCGQPDFLAPTDWVKIGTPHVIEDVGIENIGNDDLTVDSVTVDVTTGQDAWISFSGIPTLVGSGGVEYFDVTLNPSGVVTTQELLVADVVIYSDDPDDESFVAFSINTVIADTVVQVTWDTIQTSYGFALTVANQGSAGASGEGRVNMDFVYVDDSGPECDTTQDVYLYDLSPVIMYDGSGDAGSYSWGPFWSSVGPRAHNFVPVHDGDEAQLVTTDDYQEYGSNTFVTCDSVLGCTKRWYAPSGDVSFMIEKWEIYSYRGASVTGARFGEWIDWDVPSGSDAGGNEGGVVVSSGHVDYAYQQGIVNPAPDTPPCLSEDLRFGASGLLGYYFTSERETEPEANHTGLYGGFVNLDDDLFETGTDNFIVDSMWSWLNREVMQANNSADDDQQVLLSYGSFDIIPDDTLCIWTVHVSVYDGDEYALQEKIDAAETWYYDNFVKAGCCGQFADEKWPLGYSGNANCSDDGKRTLSDISRMIDFLYISKQPLCCYAAGNTNGSLDYNDQTGEYDCKITLSDISKLIDALYISKQLAAECNSICER